MQAEHTGADTDREAAAANWGLQELERVWDEQTKPDSGVIRI